MASSGCAKDTSLRSCTIAVDYNNKLASTASSNNSEQSGRKSAELSLVLLVRWNQAQH